MHVWVCAQAQSQLEGDRTAAEQRAGRLQEEVVRHQERLNVLLASNSKEALEGPGLRSGARAGGGGGKPNHNDKQRMLSDRDTMLAQVRCVRRVLNALWEPDDPSLASNTARSPVCGALATAGRCCLVVA